MTELLCNAVYAEEQQWSWVGQAYAPLHMPMTEEGLLLLDANGCCGGISMTAGFNTRMVDVWGLLTAGRGWTDSGSSLRLHRVDVCL